MTDEEKLEQLLLKKEKIGEMLQMVQQLKEHDESTVYDSGFAWSTIINTIRLDLNDVLDKIAECVYQMENEEPDEDDWRASDDHARICDLRRA